MKKDETLNPYIGPIGSNEKLMNFIEDTIVLLDARLINIDINLIHNTSSFGNMSATLLFEPRHHTYQGLLKIYFNNLKQFDLCWEDKIFYYYIDRYKLRKTEKGHYALSIDPYDEEGPITDEDSGIFISEEIHGEIIERNKI